MLINMLIFTIPKSLFHLIKNTLEILFENYNSKECNTSYQAFLDP